MLIAACSGYQYVASPRYVPLNEKKGELTGNLYMSGLQVGYAFSNKFSLFATGYQRIPTVEIGNPFGGIDGHSHRSGDSREINLGLCHFWKRNKFHYEILVGGGFGDMTFINDHEGAKNRDMNYNFKMQADRSNIFVQPNVGCKFRSTSGKFNLTVAAFTKFNRVYYHNIKTETSSGFSSNSAKPDFDAGIEYFSSRKEANLFFIEPGLCVKGGWKNFKGTAQISPVINASGHALHYQMVSINLGWSMTLDVLKKRERK